MTPYFNTKFNKEIVEKIDQESKAIISGGLDLEGYKNLAGYIQGLRDALILFNEQWEQYYKKDEDSDGNAH